MKRKRRTNWIVYLIFGIVITSFVTTVTLSRYMTNVSGNGTVTVASLDTNIASFTFTPTSLNGPGKTDKIRFNIVNYSGTQISEVDQTYSITINTDGNLPFTYELQCVDTGGNGTGINTTKNAISINSKIIGGIFEHSVQTTHEYEITITWPNSIKDSLLAEELELIKVIVDSEQIINE